MIPLAVPNLAGHEREYLEECITSTFVSSVGPFVDRFEASVAEAAGARGAVATSSGTTALHLTLHCLGVRPGDLVILPSLTFIASANAIAHCGGMPWLLDVCAESWTLDPVQLADLLRTHVDLTSSGPIHRGTGRRVAAVLPVHTLGHPADMQPIVALGEECGIPVVADAAAALGATYQDRPIGRLGAAASVISFNGNKTVTAGGGGAVVTDDDRLLRRAHHLSTTARTGHAYDHDEVGFNYRMTNLQAAVGCAQIEQLDSFVARKREIQAFYREHLRALPGVRAFPQAPWASSACWFSGIVLNEWSPAEIADVRARLRRAGVDARPFWKPMHLQRPYRDAPSAALPVTDALWERVLTLPCSTGITNAELRHVADVVHEALEDATA
jgi:perosamine synthetase